MFPYRRIEERLSHSLSSIILFFGHPGPLFFFADRGGDNRMDVNRENSIIHDYILKYILYIFSAKNSLLNIFFLIERLNSLVFECLLGVL